MIYQILKSYLFQLEPEAAHEKTFQMMSQISNSNLGKSILKTLYSYENPKLHQKIWGLEFKNPVGMAAGFDKNAEWINILPLLGFGFMEIGTVTPLPQEGNPKPRLFRLKEDFALLNRMGFNNKGMEVVKQNLQKRKHSDFVIGINIGKNKITPNENAHDDYCKCLSFLYNEGDYFVMNISSPNTPGLRDLQQKDALKNLIEPVQNLNKKLGNKPLLIKIAPDLTDQNLNDLLEVVKEYQINGLVATNTTISKDKLKSYSHEMGEGGISGKPVQKNANEFIQKIRQISSIPLIGVGGIMNVKDAMKKFHLGANLIQVYSGYIYYGPSLPKDICKEYLSEK